MMFYFVFSKKIIEPLKWAIYLVELFCIYSIVFFQLDQHVTDI